jgi:hypothetical protein
MGKTRSLRGSTSWARRPRSDVWKRVLRLRGLFMGHLPPTQGQLAPGGPRSVPAATGPLSVLAATRGAARGGCHHCLRAARGRRCARGGPRAGKRKPRGPSRAGMRGVKGPRDSKPTNPGPGPPGPFRPNPSLPRPPSQPLPSPGGQTAATMATRVSQTGRSPSEEKVPAVAAGGGHILTFSTRRPERESSREK